jgi:hypothetical protein
MPVENGIAATVLPVLPGIMGIGIIAAIKANFKVIPYLLHFAFFILLSISGFLNGNGSLETLPSLVAAAGVLYFLVLGIYMFLFNNSYSKYSSIAAATMTVLPLIPLSFLFYINVAEPSTVFTMDISAFRELISIALLISLFLYTAANSAYLEYVNRKAFHR